MDAVLDPSGQYNVTLSVDNGTLSATSITGTLAEVNAALQTVSYTPDADFHGTAAVSVTVTDEVGGVIASGAGAATGNTTTLDIAVTPVNDDPVNAVPNTSVDALDVAEDTDLAFTGANAISISDVDAGTGDVKVTLQVAEGTLTLPATTGVTETRPNSRTVELVGVTTAINAALLGLSYRGDLNFNGSDALTIITDDLVGGTETDTVNISVSSVIDTLFTDGVGGDTVDFTTYVHSATDTNVDWAEDGNFTNAGDGGDTVTLASAADLADSQYPNVLGVPDTFFGGAGDDTITGGDLNDTIDGGDDNDNLAGGGGDDHLIGGGGTDTLAGDGDVDTLEGGDGNDDLDGGAGDDELTGGAGDDTLDGGADSDTAHFSGSFADYSIHASESGDFTVTDDNPDDAGGDDGTDTLSNVETLEFADRTATVHTVVYDLNYVPDTDDDGQIIGQIQAAINAAAAGDIIMVGAGTYKEYVVIDKSLTLIGDIGDADVAGAGPSVILDGTGLGAGPENSSGIRIDTAVSDVTIEGFVIQNYTAGPDGRSSGIDAWNEIAGNSNVTIDNNTISDNTWNGVFVGSNYSGAGPDNWTVSNNLVQDNGVYGIELTNATNSTISGNEVSGGWQGIYMTSQARDGSVAIASNNEILDNTVSGAERGGISIYSFRWNDLGDPPSVSRIEGLTISGNTVEDGANYGIELFSFGGAFLGDIQNVTVTDNTATNNGAETPIVHFNDTGAVAFADNTVEGSGNADTFAGTPGNDFIIGGAGDDTLTGGDGNDTFIFGAGDGNDTFIFGAGDGNNAITDFGIGDNTLLFEGFGQGDLIDNTDGGDLVIGAADADGTVQVTLQDTAGRSYTVNEETDENGQTNTIVTLDPTNGG